MEKIARYQTIRSIGKGGMGEIFLVHDPLCNRDVALKQVRTDLQEHERVRNRFVHEAKITATLTHPGIISIYSIHEEKGQIFYTMPYVEGKSLKQLLRSTPHPLIPTLLPIFLTVCQTIAYAHSKGVVHRDLKPENILVGKFGEVILLDWGLAQYLSAPSEELLDIEETSPELTHPGKIVGTLSFMAPERALGTPATIQTDIYSLGVMLYQILTLHLPFTRKTLKEYRLHFKKETLIDPEEVAPYRDVPPPLSRIVRKCLKINLDERYQTVEELIDDLNIYMEGRSEWQESTLLDVKKKQDWEFQENVLISKHIALTPATEAADWISLMISKTPFAENLRLETKISIGEKGHGIGFLLAVPEAEERTSPLDGYCLWLGTEEEPHTRLLRNTVEVTQQPSLYLTPKKWHELVIEKIENHIKVTIDGTQRFTYLSYLPIAGTHVGLVARDADFKMEAISISIGNQNLQVSCLAIPDAFLASKDYKRALAEYRRIGYSFPGHAEGREALFRGGITLLEEAKTVKNTKKRQALYSAALEEFGKLHKTPGAPLEYLGKSLVYKTLGDHSEEIKCLELALRRYHKHPLIHTLKEQISYRMHESAQHDRRSAYQLILIVLRLLPGLFDTKDSLRLFSYLIKHWEQLPFLENPIDPSLLGKEESAKENEINFATPLAFWLAAPYTLLEILEDAQSLEDDTAQANLIYSLFEVGSFGLAQKAMQEFPGREQFMPLLLCYQDSLSKAIENLDLNDIGVRKFRVISYLLQYALRTDQDDSVHTIAGKLVDLPLSREDRIQLDGYRIWAYLKHKKIKEAEAIFDDYPLEMLNQETTLLHPLYGCFLFLTEGEEIAEIHFSGVIDTPFPRTWALLSHELINKISENPSWYNTSFMWERRHLYRQLTLYYQCVDNPELEKYYRHLEKQEYL